MEITVVTSCVIINPTTNPFKPCDAISSYENIMAIVLVINEEYLRKLAIPLYASIERNAVFSIVKRRRVKKDGRKKP